VVAEDQGVAEVPEDVEVQEVAVEGTVMTMTMTVQEVVDYSVVAMVVTVMGAEDLLVVEEAEAAAEVAEDAVHPHPNTC